MRRRNFLKGTSLLFGSAFLAPTVVRAARQEKTDYGNWKSIREQFLLDAGYLHFAQMLLASHPKIVRDEIEMHRRKFDLMPVEYWENNWMEMEPKMRTAAASYIGALPDEVALTDSTSMGLGLLYTGFRLKPGDEVLTTTHDHYATEKSLEFAAAKSGATIRRITLYKEPATVSAQEMVNAIKVAIKPATRVVAVTWVHSSTGMKLPIREIGNVIKQANEQRPPAKRIYYCVDGVHGFGIENVTMDELGCDFFAAGTHKWIFGPRGTGILYGRKNAWDMIIPTIPSFTGLPYGVWLGVVPDIPMSFSDLCTPGGFHSFEHRWSLHKAFEFQQEIGKAKVQERTHQLSSLLKDGLRQIKHIKIHTPASTDLSSGINCFEVDGMDADSVVKKLFAQKIIGSSTPYRTSYARLTPSLVNSEEEVRTCVKALERIKS